MNIHKLKSFHEAALEQWNSIAVIINEAISTVAPEQRSQVFIQTVMALTDIAGINQTYRMNIIKGADVMLPSLFHVAENHKRTPENDTSSIASQPAWKRFLTIIRRSVITILVVGLLAGSFVLGRLSMQPRMIPFIPTNLPTPVPEASPERIVQLYFEAVRQKDMTRVLELCHTEMVKSHSEFIIGEATQLANIFPQLQEIQTLKVEIDETAEILVNIVDKRGESETGKFVLRKQQGQWRFIEIGF
jgi:hypothetical protein